MEKITPNRNTVKEKAHPRDRFKGKYILQFTMTLLFYSSSLDPKSYKLGNQGVRGQSNSSPEVKISYHPFIVRRIGIATHRNTIINARGLSRTDENTSNRIAMKT